MPLTGERFTALADQVVGAANARDLLAGLERQLAQSAALPARLYLNDPASGTFYPGAAFACEREVPDQPVDILIDPPDGWWVLYHHGDPVGLLEVLAATPDAEAVETLCQLLGPSLMVAQQGEMTLRELQRTHEQMRQVVSAGHLLHHMEVEKLLVRILESVLEAVQAQVGAVLTVDDKGDLETRVAWGMREDHVDGIRTRTGERFVDQAFAANKRLVLDAEAVAQELDLTQLDAQLDGVLVLPLASQDRRYGIILLANPEHSFTDDLQRLGECVRDMAAIALDNNALVQKTLEQQRLQHDLEIATEVQLGMYPKEDLVVDGITVLGSSRPCDETGGDYYAYHGADGHVYALIGDVTGHGLGAALYTTMAHAVAQLQLHSGADIVDNLNAVNRALGYSSQGRFMTAALVDIDVASRTFSYASAGHNPLLWIHEGKPVWLESTSMPLGIMPEMCCERAPGVHRLSPGDCLLLYTDGFPEAQDIDGVLYDEDRLAELVSTAVSAGAQPDVIRDNLYHAIDAWMGENKQADDLTVVVIGVS